MCAGLKIYEYSKLRMHKKNCDIGILKKYQNLSTLSQ